MIPDTTTDDDPSLEAWLRETPDELPDNGFTAAVMQRVRLETLALRPGLASATALERLRARGHADRRIVRWHLGGIAVGALFAGNIAWTQMDVMVVPAPAQLLAVVLALAAVAWAAADGVWSGS
jgi:hypothetical protein